MIIETIMQAINESWWWLGPLQLCCWITALVALIVEVFYRDAEEVR